jgi:hypothetical protein
MASLLKNKILMICPSRSRPQSAYEVIDTWEKTQSGLSDLVFYTDDDDSTVEDYPKPAHPNIAVVRGSRKGITGSTNQAVLDFPEYSYYGFIGDDHRFRTINWDKVFIDTIRKKGKGWGVAYGDDLLMREQLPTEVVISGNIVRAMGCMVYPELKHLYIDNFWKEIGLGIERLFYIPEIIIEHMHYTAGKSVQDELYKEVNAPATYELDRNTFIDFVANIKDIYVNKIKKAMENG